MLLRFLQPDISLIKTGWQCLCPRCGKAKVYKQGEFYTLYERCPVCELNLSENDSADGPAVFLIFILGFLLVPLALLVEVLFAPPLWFHTILWSVVALGLTLGALRPLKAYIIALQYKHLPWDKS